MSNGPLIAATGAGLAQTLGAAAAIGITGFTAVGAIAGGAAPLTDANDSDGGGSVEQWWQAAAGIGSSEDTAWAGTSAAGGGGSAPATD